jgi:hypothetical protein
MVANGFKCVDTNSVYATCVSVTRDTPATYAKKLDLYDRVIFVDDFKSKYVCLYESSNTLVAQDHLDGTECVVLEKTINPQIDPRTYVCIKVGSECREDLRKIGE